MGRPRPGRGVVMPSERGQFRFAHISVPANLLGALVTFIVTVADLTIANIGAAFWGLVAGIVVSLLLERPDFTARSA